MTHAKHIVFILPGAGTVPCGGFKVVYEYANGLVSRGHRVTVVHPACGTKDVAFIERLKKSARYVQRRPRHSYRPTRWFNVDPRVTLLWVPTLDCNHVPDADVVVATAWQTAEWVADYPASKGAKFYLIQHLETWSGQRDRVVSTWTLPLNKIVISRWLQDFASSLGEEATYIPNGLDFTSFGMDNAPEHRQPSRVMMLYHTDDWKGSAEGLEALQIVKQKEPALEVSLFGVFPAPQQVPQWITYHRNPPQKVLRQLYNEASIFVSPSWAEGWPLPPAEALMCGAALVATDIGGHREYAIPGETALLAPSKKPQDLATQILRLVQDPEFRVSLGHRGNEYIQQFTWSRAVDSFESAIASTVFA